MQDVLSPVASRWIANLPEQDRAAAEAHARYGAVHLKLVSDMRILLRAHGVSQRELAERMHTTESSISRMLDEDGARGIKLETIVRFAEALGVDLARSCFLDESLVAPAPNECRTWSVVATPRHDTIWIRPETLVTQRYGSVSDEARLPVAA